MSLDPRSARSRSPSPAPNHTHDRRCSTPGLRPSAVPSRTPSPSVSPAMLPQGLGIQDLDVEWSPIGDSASDHGHSSSHAHDRWRLTGRKGYNALPNTPPSRDLSPAAAHGRSRSIEDRHSHSHHGAHGSQLAPPTPPEHLSTLSPGHYSAGVHGRKGYNSFNHHHQDQLPFSPVEVSDAGPLRNRDHGHGLGAMGRKGYNSTPRSLSPNSCA